MQDEALLPLPVSVDRWRLVQDGRYLHRAIGKELLFFSNHFSLVGSVGAATIYGY